MDVNALWNTLYREQSDSVREQPERHSLLNLPYPAVVPGDRFRCSGSMGSHPCK